MSISVTDVKRTKTVNYSTFEADNFIMEDPRHESPVPQTPATAKRGQIPPLRSDTIMSTSTGAAVYVGADGLNRSKTVKSDIAAKLFKKFETIDFEEPDHAVLRLHYKNQSRFTVLAQDVAHYLLSLLMVVIISALYLGLTYSTEYASEYRLERIKEFVENNDRWMGTLFAIGTAVAAIIVPVCLVVFVAPSAIGSGMTEVIAFLNGASALSGIDLRVLFVKYVSIIGMVSAGFFSGIDGPMSEVGAGVAMMLVKGATRWTWFRRIFYGETLDLGRVNDKSDVATELKESKGSAAIERAEEGDDEDTGLHERKLAGSLLGFLEQRQIRLFATLGAAVSIAVIFAAPVGGVLFAVEEATSFFELSLLIKLTFATIAGFLIVTYTQFGIKMHETLSNIYLDPLEASLIPLDSACKFEMRWSMIVSYMALALLCGLFGQVMNKGLSFIQRKRQKYLIEPEVVRKKECEWDKKNGKPAAVPIPVNKKINSGVRIFEVILVAVITAVVVVWIPSSETVDKCVPLTTPLSHLPSLVSECDFSATGKSLTCETLSSCKAALDDGNLCFPTSYENQFAEYVVKLYQASCSTLESLVAPSLQEHTSTPSEPETGHHRRSTASNISSFSVNDFAPYLTYNPNDGSDLGQQLIVEHEGAELKCYYQVRTLFWTSPERQLKMLLSRGLYNLWDLKSLAIFFIIYVIMSSLTYYVALPTDLVVPNLIMGAAFGRFIGLILNQIRPGFADPGAYALLGMAGLWSGTSGLVLTVTAVALELTGDFSYLPALILVTFTSAWVSNTIGPSLYHIEMENNGAPYLPAEPARLLRTIATRDVMQKSIVALGAVESLATIKSILMQYDYNGFPVVQKVIVKDVDNRYMSFHSSMHDSAAKNGIAYRFRPVGYVTSSRLAELVEDLERERRTENSTFNLESIISSAPLVVREDTTAAKVYSLFRQLGLKRVFVVNAEGFLTGLVVRRDLIRPVLEAEEAEERGEEESDAQKYVEHEKSAQNLNELARRFKRRSQPPERTPE